MPQVSRRPLNQSIQSEMFRLFWYSISQLKSAGEVAAFFSDVLSDTEEQMIAKRCMVDVLLMRGRSTIEIKEKLHVSNSLISSVGSWLKNAQPQTKAVFEQVLRLQGQEASLDSLQSALDSLPKRYHTDWAKTAVTRNSRAVKRATRKALR